MGVGTMGVEEFLEWKIDVDRFFDVMRVPENKDPESGLIHQWLKGIFAGQYGFTKLYGLKLRHSVGL
ncbi:hypothetical protein KIW84_033912 [Lathyrus oleraceus]|uniref:Uncharacterized protein n=1 Tax=Pisum sativum TaxID=3888 RepID=A0A9D5B3T0_PEA|nr:hypothetical protein KIW84_033912 [Pisum sativum]